MSDQARYTSMRNTSSVVLLCVAFIGMRCDNAEAQTLEFRPNAEFTQLTVGDEFEVAVEIAGLTPQQSIEFVAAQIVYDDRYLSLDRVWPGSNLPDASAFTAGVFPGSVEPIYDVLFGGPDSAITTNQSLASMDFTVIGVGDSVIGFSFLDALGTSAGESFSGIAAGEFLAFSTTGLATITGDFNLNSLIDAGDMDLLSGVVKAATHDVAFDLNRDNLVDATDRVIWISDIAKTATGDADLNRRVEFSDFLTLSSSFGGAGGWADGDFNGDGAIGFPDFLLLSGNFGYVMRAQAVPEPASMWLVGWVTAPLLARKRRKHAAGVKTSIEAKQGCHHGGGVRRTPD